MVSVEEIRIELTRQQNNAYTDQQIKRWIGAKSSNKVDIINVINAQKVNEVRLKAIVTNASRFRRVIHELNRGTINIIHIREQHRVVVYIDQRDMPSVFEWELQCDVLTAFMYYLQEKVCS